MNGFQKLWKTTRCCWICLLLSLPLVGPGTLRAQEGQEENLPSPELIEFLGTFEDKDVGWVDPFEILDMDDEELACLPDQEVGHEEKK